SPFALLKSIAELCRRTSEFAWLKLKPLSGHYHDHAFFREEIRRRLMNRIEIDMRKASGLVDELAYEELFRRYINHVSAFVKREKIRNPVTRKDEDPDPKLMGEVEDLLGITGDPKPHRDTMISMVAAWAIEHRSADDSARSGPMGPMGPGSVEPARSREADIDTIFPEQIRQVRTSAFLKLRKPLATLMKHVVAL